MHIKLEHELVVKCNYTTPYTHHFLSRLSRQHGKFLFYYYSYSYTKWDLCQTAKENVLYYLICQIKGILHAISCCMLSQPQHF